MDPLGQRHAASDLTTFIGREEELRTAAELLSRSRLLTLTGPGGVGKTRLVRALARQVAQRFPGGIGFVALEDIKDADLLADTVASALGLAETEREPLQTVTERIGESDFLLVLDNCEHLVAACTELVTQLLSRCPGLRVAATSQHVLRVAAERVMTVPPMELTSEAATDDAIALFVERAQAGNPAFRLTPENAGIVAAICRRLEGLPLSIEMAAARMRHLSAQALLDHLDEVRQLPSDGSGQPDRHRTMGSAVRWSYDLCDPLEQDVVAQASEFVGGFDLDAAQAVLRLPTTDSATPSTVADVVFGLIDKSIIIRIPGPETSPSRYRMLEPLREFGAAILAESGRSAAVRLLHRDHYLALALRGDTEYCTAAEVGWFRDVELDLPNVRAALRTSLDDAEDPDRAARMALSLRPYWTHYGHMREGAGYLTEVAASEGLEASLRLRALATAAKFAVLIGSTDAARSALSAHRAAEASGAPHWPGARTEAEAYVAFAERDLAGALALARQAVDEALEAGELAIGLEALTWAALLAMSGRDPAAADLADRLHTQAEHHDTPWFRAAALWLQGMNMWSRGDDVGALERFRAGLVETGPTQRLGTTAGNIDGSALVAAGAGDLRKAARLMGAADAIWRHAELWLPLSSAVGLRHATVEEIVAQLSRREYEIEFAAGSRMGIDEAVREALEVEPVRPRRASPLTRREQEIAALVSDGLTSREIASRLVVSPRTVETHVDHILTKLGMRTRTQIATWWTRHTV